MTNPYRALCAELAEELHEHTCLYEGHESELVARARALLDQQPVSPPFKLPEPERPTDQEIARFLADRYRERMDNQKAAQVTDARAVLARWGRLAAAPVPLSERLPVPEDCDEQGRCWLGGHQMGNGTPTWLLGYPAWAERFPDVHRFWLPAHALPLPPRG